MLEKFIPDSIRKSIYESGYRQAVSDINITEDYGKLSNLFEDKKSIEDFQRKIRDIKDSNDYESIVSLTSAYIKIANTRETIISAVENARKFYLVNVILDQLTQDSLAPDIDTNEILDLTSPDITIKKELDFLNDKFNLNRLVEDITPDMCAYGDYTVSPVVKEKEGLVDIVDNVNQSKVVPLINRGEVLGYIYMDENDTQLKIVDPSKFLCFSLLSSRIRIDLFDDASFGTVSSMTTSLSNSPTTFSWSMPNANKAVTMESPLPRYIRIGKSVIYPIIGKLRELELLETLVPASKLAQLTKGSILGITVPQSANIDLGFDAAKRMESLINAKIGFSITNNMVTADQIINAAGKTKVIPIFGDKGELHKMDYKMDEISDLMSSIDETRRVICSSMGIPSEILFGGDGGSKSDLLKRYSRYLRKIRGIQHSVTFAIKQLCSIHLNSKGIKFKPDDIEVTFRNKIMDISEVENLEFKDSSVGIIQNFANTVSSIAGLPGMANAVDNKALATFIKSIFTTIGIPSVINPDKVTDEPANSEGGNDSDFFGGPSNDFDDMSSDNEFNPGEFTASEGPEEIGNEPTEEPGEDRGNQGTTPEPTGVGPTISPLGNRG